MTHVFEMSSYQVDMQRSDGERGEEATAPLIEMIGVEKLYRMGRLDYPALRGIDLRIGAGELVAVVGPSGSGKTTILNLIAGINRPSSGTVTVDGRRIDTMSEEQVAVWRGEHVGVVFQFFQLLPTLSALENAVLPLHFARRGAKRDRLARACVGTLLAVLGLAAGAAYASRASWGDHGEDVKITAQGHHRFDAVAASLMRATPGVASIEPMFVTDVDLAGKDARIWAVRQATMFHYRLASGRWYTAAEEQGHARVAVVERTLARITGTRLGDTITVQTAPGPVSLRVIGISTNQQEDGTALFVPLTTMHALMTGMAVDDNDYWVRTTSPSHALIDSTTTRLEDTLARHGYPVDSEIKYVRLANEVASGRTITTTLAVVGFLIVAISMAGLASALTTSVIERTREIGILRSIGARARDIRRIFATETIALAVAGWVIAVPVGYALDRFLVWMLREVANLDVPFTFPPAYIAVALAGTILLALFVTLLPIRRAAHYRPCDALRYA